MSIHGELTFALLFAWLVRQKTCDNVLDHKIHFLSEDTTTENVPLKEAELTQEERDAEIEKACHQIYSVAKPQFDPRKRISANKCNEFRYLVDEIQFNLTAAAECKKKQNEGYSGIFVIGGKETTPGEFPHMAAIGWSSVEGGYTFKCGGSLISTRHVLTAGHCLISGRDSSLRSLEPAIVRLGDQNLLDVSFDGLTPEDYNISRSIKHPQYQPPNKYFDIAILELATEVKVSHHVRPACLWSMDYFPFKEADITGWGVTRVGDLKISPQLLKATVDLIDSGRCDALLLKLRNRLWKGLQDHQLCAGTLKGGTDTCQGDSGGPLQVREILKPNYYLIGVTSFGFQCGLRDTPGIYSRVSTFVPWIESVVWPRG